MVILGVDPGSRRIGFGLVRKTSGSLEYIDAGILNIGGLSDAEVMTAIKKEVLTIIKKHRPTLLAIEKLFFSKNRKTALQVAEARGVIILAASEAGLKTKEFTPNEIKLGVTGYGLADKKAVAKMVWIILRGETPLGLPDDATDALAAAICASKHTSADST